MLHLPSVCALVLLYVSGMLAAAVPTPTATPRVPASPPPTSLDLTPPCDRPTADEFFSCNCFWLHQRRRSALVQPPLPDPDAVDGAVRSCVAFFGIDLMRDSCCRLAGLQTPCQDVVLEDTEPGMQDIVDRCA